MLPTTNSTDLQGYDDFFNNKTQLIQKAKDLFNYDLDLSDYTVLMVAQSPEAIHIWFDGDFNRYVVFLVAQHEYPNTKFRVCYKKDSLKFLKKGSVYYISNLTVLEKYNQSDTYTQLSQVYDWLQTNSVDVIKRPSGAIVLQKS